MTIRTSPLTVSALIKQYGVTRPMVKSVIYNRFFVPMDYKCCLYYYRLKTWSGHQFAAYLTNEGMLRTGDPEMTEQFNVIYQYCTPHEVKKAKTVLISFRLAEDSFNIEPVALVKLGQEHIVEIKS